MFSVWVLKVPYYYLFRWLNVLIRWLSHIFKLKTQASITRAQTSTVCQQYFIPVGISVLFFLFVISCLTVYCFWLKLHKWPTILSAVFFAVFYFEYDNGGGQKEGAARPLGGCGERSRSLSWSDCGQWWGEGCGWRRAVKVDARLQAELSWS